MKAVQIIARRQVELVEIEEPEIQPSDVGRIKVRVEKGCLCGSDVPFFLANGPAVCRGRGERVEPVGCVGALHFVVVRPPAGLATAAVYGVCRPAAGPRRVEGLLEALSQGNMDRTGRLLFNRLQPAAETLSPWIERLRRSFAAEDFIGHGMSGSGTSYFGVCRHASHARRVARRLQANGVGSVFAVRSCR